MLLFLGMFLLMFTCILQIWALRKLSVPGLAAVRNRSYVLADCWPSFMSFIFICLWSAGRFRWWTLFFVVWRLDSCHLYCIINCLWMSHVYLFDMAWRKECCALNNCPNGLQNILEKKHWFDTKSMTVGSVS